MKAKKLVFVGAMGAILLSVGGASAASVAGTSAKEAQAAANAPTRIASQKYVDEWINTRQVKLTAGDQISLDDDGNINGPITEHLENGSGDYVFGRDTGIVEFDGISKTYSISLPEFEGEGGLTVSYDQATNKYTLKQGATTVYTGDDPIEVSDSGVISVKNANGTTQLGVVKQGQYVQIVDGVLNGAGIVTGTPGNDTVIEYDSTRHQWVVAMPDHVDGVATEGAYDSATNQYKVNVKYDGTTITVDNDGNLKANYTNYTAGDYIDETDFANGTISVDLATGATAETAGAVYAGENITITNGKIDAKDTTYTDGTGIKLDGTEFSVVPTIGAAGGTVVSATADGFEVSVPNIGTNTDGVTVGYDADSNKYSVDVDLDSVTYTAGHGLSEDPDNTFNVLAGEGLRVDPTNDWVELVAGTTTTLGGVKDGDRVTIDGNGVLSADLANTTTAGAVLPAKSIEITNATTGEIGVNVDGATITIDSTSGELKANAASLVEQGTNTTVSDADQDGLIEVNVAQATNDTLGVVKAGAYTAIGTGGQVDVKPLITTTEWTEAEADEIPTVQSVHANTIPRPTAEDCDPTEGDLCVLSLNTAGELMWINVTDPTGVMTSYPEYGDALSPAAQN